MALDITSSRAKAAVVVALVVVAAAAYWAWPSGVRSKAETGATASANPPRATAHNQDSVDLSDSQLASVKVEPVEDREFPVEKEAVGSIDFDEDMETQVFTPYQGKIIALLRRRRRRREEGPDAVHPRQPRPLAGRIRPLSPQPAFWN